MEDHFLDINNIKNTVSLVEFYENKTLVINSAMLHKEIIFLYMYIFCSRFVIFFHCITEILNINVWYATPVQAYRSSMNVSWIIYNDILRSEYAPYRCTLDWQIVIAIYLVISKDGTELKPLGCVPIGFVYVFLWPN